MEEAVSGRWFLPPPSSGGARGHEKDVAGHLVFSDHNSFFLPSVFKTTSKLGKEKNGLIINNYFALVTLIYGRERQSKLVESPLL